MWGPHTSKWSNRVSPPELLEYTMTHGALPSGVATRIGGAAALIRRGGGPLAERGPPRFPTPARASSVVAQRPGVQDPAWGKRGSRITWAAFASAPPSPPPLASAALDPVALGPASIAPTN